MRKERIIFKIECKPLTSKRKRKIAPHEATRIGRPLRIVLAAGGIYLFFLGTSGDAPSSIAGIATFFTVFGIVAFLLAVFIQDLVDMFYFAKAKRKGSFPAGVIVGKGGFYTKTESTETHAPLSAIGKVKEQEDYFKVPLRAADPREIFLFKEDFEEGDPEDFIDYFRSK